MSEKIVCVESVEEAVAALREHGLRGSAAQRLVAEALVAADGPGSAERIAVGRVSRFDIASVYRLYALAGAVAAATAALIVLH